MFPIEGVEVLFEAMEGAELTKGRKVLPGRYKVVIKLQALTITFGLRVFPVLLTINLRISQLTDIKKNTK